MHCFGKPYPLPVHLLPHPQYIEPGDASKLSHAELVVVDEAAAIPLPQVKALISSCNAIMASTINGWVIHIFIIATLFLQFCCIPSQPCQHKYCDKQAVQNTFTQQSLVVLKLFQTKWALSLSAICLCLNLVVTYSQWKAHWTLKVSLYNGRHEEMQLLSNLMLPCGYCTTDITQN